MIFFRNDVEGILRGIAIARSPLTEDDILLLTAIAEAFDVGKLAKFFKQHMVKLGEVKDVRKY